MSENSSRKACFKSIRRDPVQWSSNEKSPYFDILDAFFSQKKFPDTIAGVLDMYQIDEVTGEEIRTGPYSGWGGYVEYPYHWEDKDLYHFYKYNMPLNDSFIAFVLADYEHNMFRVKKKKRCHGRIPPAILQKRRVLEFRWHWSKPGLWLYARKAERRRKKRELWLPREESGFGR